jgi:Glycosyltransferase sugar-binding region containing DXD motif
VIQYWDSERIPGYVSELLAGVGERNPDLRHLVFDERTAAELIAERFGGRHLEAFRTCAVPAMQADYLRYCAVYALGGVYVDADFRCVAPLRPLLGGPLDGVLFGRPELPARWRVPAFEWRERVGPHRAIMNSFFAFSTAGHPLLGLAIEIATANVERRVGHDVALVTGPAIFTSLYLMRELGSFDAFVAYVKGGALEPFGRFLCETVGDHERASAALDRVWLRPETDSRRWVLTPEEPLPYKASEDHWVNVDSGIFR